MVKNKLFVKQSKCKFASKEIDYLGHIVSREGVHANPVKVEAMLKWPRPLGVF